ncbi:MAG TPA: peptidyl-prolyl cis-trans isomerase [Pyrinomonadaceae bacterium]|nr:peptidyl-prolyl cis-trans isomerase [Pyrinomonadaceae bacterium]
MKTRIIRLTVLAAFALVVMLTPSLVFAQEGELQVVDEVIAQVNDDIITLSSLRNETKQRIDALKQNGMTEQQAIDEVTKHRDELIATLINEKLLLQKGKQLEMSDKVEAEVNRRMLDVAKEQGIPTMEKLYEAMRQSGVSPEEMRGTLRAEIMKQAVMEQEVDSKLFFGFTVTELHAYFESHKDKFRKPEVVKISEIFLGLAGRDEAQVKAKAEQLVAQLRAGADFAKLAAANSEREEQGKRLALTTGGSVGLFEVPNLRADIAAAIKNVKAGAVSDPVKTNDGYQIFRVDERIAGSDAPVFNENKVREAMTIERSPKAHEDYLQNLRNEAYIKLSPNYSAGVLPLLKIKEEVTAEATDVGSGSRPAGKEHKGKGKFLKIFPKPF